MRMLHQIARCVYGAGLVLLGACSGGAEDASPEEGGVATVLPEEKNEVTVRPLVRRMFYHELVSNGKLTASEEADLYFEASGVVARIYVKNGEQVKKGDKLAELDKFRLHNAVMQAQDGLEKAKLELKNVLIGQGYGAEDTVNVPADVMRLARVKSGYDQRKAQYELARHEEEHATLTAPFDGVVANLFTKPFNTVEGGKPFCTIVGVRQMEVGFTLLENELSLVKRGDKVVITPYANPASQCEGRITEINPLVDEKGMVQAKAVLTAREGLFSGMNVRVNVHRELSEQLVVPKSAVVLRSGKQVVFSLKGTKAQWNYVQTGLENADSYTLVDTGENLHEGDTLIVTGNVNLAHESEVIVAPN